MTARQEGVKHTPTLTVVDAYYPGMRALKGLSFNLTVVMSAIDISFDEATKREDELQRLALAWNAHSQLTAEVARLKSALQRIADYDAPDALALIVIARTALGGGS